MPDGVASDLDQRTLLHTVADRLNIVADHLPLPHQLGPDPAVGEVLDDEIRNLAGLLTYLAGESAIHHRDTARARHRPQAADRFAALALARAARPTGAALAALAAAVHDLGVLADLTRRAAGPRRTAPVTAACHSLVDDVASARTHLAHAAKLLRTAADTRTTPATTAVPPPTATTRTSRTR
ncbi:hypothetical protein ACIQPR_46080 [Streptomyces sp. NPDC091280]|uniref:hypothetical protein n=1 Tax=Streptomyces sp. NPDC091280 TaxID=3365984 RepID=UPI003801DC98